MRFDQGENTVVVIRKHWLVFVSHILGTAFGAFLPLVLMRYIPDQVLAFFPADVAGPIAAFVYLTWLVILWVMLFASWTWYYLNVWVITNRRMIDIHQKGLFSRELVSAELEKVQDVTIDSEGLFQSIFDFGTLSVTTASNTSDFTMTNAAHPNEAREQILAAHATCMEQYKTGVASAT